MPVAWRAASSTTRCVSAAGCWISVSVEPRLTAGVTSRSALTTRDAAANPPATSTAIIVPGPSICRPSRRAGSPPGSPG